MNPPNTTATGFTITPVTQPVSFGGASMSSGTAFGGGSGSGFSFPSGATASVQPQPGASGFTLGTGVTTAVSGSGFTFGTPATKPAGFSFAAPASTATTTAPQFSFGGAPRVGPATTTTSSNLAFNIGTPASTLNFPAPAATTTTTTTVITSTPATGFAFPASTAAPMVSTSASLGFGSTTQTTTTGFTLGMGSTSAGLTTTTQTTTTTGSVPAGASMNFRQLEENINKWSLELDEQEKVFLNQATQVNAWDNLLISNGEKIISLNESVDRVKLDQQRLDHELDFIRSQQRELEEMLVPLEQSVEGAPPTDREREHTYEMAEDIDAQLKMMAEDLKEVIEHINASNNNQDSMDPVVQIGKILNVHMDSLQWIEENTSILGRQLEDVTKQHEIRKRDQEKSLRMGLGFD